MKEPYILLVEDELHIAQGLKFNLEMEGFQVRHVTTGEEALDLLPWSGCLLVILDLMLPAISGIEVCRRMRQADARLPILILTAMDKETDRITGLEEGADDYLTKPFSLTEFLLRVKGIIKRSNWYRTYPKADEGYVFSENQVFLEDLRAIVKGREISLTDLEAKMLRIFFEREGEILSRAELLESVWGMAPDTETRTLDNFVVRLRKYFEKKPSRPVHFLTVRGRGYRFVRKASD
jgi:two-component system alkaline phosphatase synthesis response regulator PhoP